MFVTTELLRKLNACENGIKYIERFYPNGAEMIDIIQDHHIDKEFLHWGRQHLTATDEELTAYCKSCKIINSDGFWYSVNVCNSNCIIESKNIEDSINVFNSTEVSNSENIVQSETVSKSKQIILSSLIDNCEKIYKSNNISNSLNVFDSTMVLEGKNIVNSFNVFNSSEIIKSSQVTDSYFCANCKNIKFCMFCEGLENVEYHIFNQPFSKERYIFLVQQYKKYVTELLSIITNWPEDINAYKAAISLERVDKWFGGFSKTFSKWVKTLPGYNEEILYNITFFPEFLI